MAKSAGYSGAPLVRRLGIKPGATVGLIGAPNGIEETIGELPDGAVLRTRPRGSCDLALAFARAERELDRRFERAEELTGGRGIWIALAEGLLWGRHRPDRERGPRRGPCPRARRPQGVRD